jgi:hypothetical protein
MHRSLAYRHNQSFVLAVLLGLCTACNSATAPSNITLGSKRDKMTWDFTNSCSVQVDVQLFDKTTGGVWPAFDRVHRLDPGGRWVYRLECNTKSKICYGAGLRSDYSRFWGVGLYNNQACSDCCHVCDGSDPLPISLTSNQRC